MSDSEEVSAVSGVVASEDNRRDATTKPCEICGSLEGILNIDTVHTVSSPDGPVFAHYFCLLFSSGLGQKGGEGEGIKGFLAQDIRREIKRGGRLKCVYCRRKGATVGCAEQRCKKSYHLNCGSSHHALLQFFDQFKSFCKEHRLTQRPQAALRDRQQGDAGNLCTICQERLVRKATLKTLWAPCCSAFYHRDCVQSQAVSAGRHHFRCPLCNNTRDFLQEMRTFGIYIPEQDAGWETVAQSEEEGGLVEPLVCCQAKICFCDREEGRALNQEGGLWEVLLCAACGSRGIHAKCGGMEDSPDPVWHCYVCRSVMRENGTESTFLVHTSKVLQKVDTSKVWQKTADNKPWQNTVDISDMWQKATDTSKLWHKATDTSKLWHKSADLPSGQPSLSVLPTSLPGMGQQARENVYHTTILPECRTVEEKVYQPTVLPECRTVVTVVKDKQLSTSSRDKSSPVTRNLERAHVTITPVPSRSKLEEGRLSGSGSHTKFSSNTSLTDVLGSLLDQDGSPGDSDYESSHGDTSSYAAISPGDTKHCVAKVPVVTRNKGLVAGGDAQTRMTDFFNSQKNF